MRTFLRPTILSLALGLLLGAGASGHSQVQLGGGGGSGGGSGFTTAAQVIAAWTGTCNASSVLAGNGVCLAVSSAFSGLTSATNTSAAMVVGSGASLAATGTGTITATGLGTLTQNLLFTDATYDIGASGATRPRNVFISGTITTGAAVAAGTNITLGTTSSIIYGTRSGIASPADKTIELFGNGFATMSQLSLGPTSSSNPAIRISGNAAGFRRGDNTIATFSTLPACASGTEGFMAPVSDSVTAVWGVTVTGSGSNHVLAYCDGTNWTVMGS